MKINGSLLFDASSASEIQNLRVQKYTGSLVPVHNSGSDQGRLIFVTADGGPYLANTLYFGGAAAWLPIASGGDAAALQTEVDAIETSLGAGVNSNGTFNAAAFPAQAALNSPTSFTDAINQIAAYATSNDTLAELDDVTLGTLATGDFLRYNGTTWADHTLVLADVTDVTATAAEVNLALDGITASAAELNILDGVVGTTAADISSIAGFALEDVSATEFGYLDGVTSPIQAQLDNLQAEDATLTALAALDGTPGILVQTGVDAFTKRELVAPAAGITITNPAGTAGNPTFALANDLAALEGLTGTGYIVRTGDGTAVTRAIDGNTGRIVITNADGVSTNTNIDLATVTDLGTGTFLKFTRDTYGRVEGTTAVVASDITGLVDSVYVNVIGDSMSGDLTMTGGATVTGLPTPVGSTDAANKAYVDAVAEGLATKPAVDAATTVALTATYDNGTAGVGATLTNSGTQAALVVDGVTLTAGMSVLVKNQADPAENGRYVVTDAGSVSTNWVLTRCGLCDEADEIPGAYVFVKDGSQEGTGWVQIVDDPLTFVVGTDDIDVFQFSGAGTYSAGAGLSLNGTEFNVNLGAGIVELPGDEVGIHLLTPSSGGLRLTLDGSTDSTASGAMLQLRLPAGSGLTQDGSGLYIAAGGVTNTMLQNSTITINADAGGTDNVALGETILFAGTSTQGITTNRSADNTITVSALDASSSQKGVASFDATEFTVTAGNVVLGTVPIGKIATPTINFVGTDASADTVTLGESFTFVDGGSATQLPLVRVAIAANQATVTLRRATTGDRGVASFAAGNFSVDAAGEVTLNSTLDDLANVSGADAATTDDLLTKSAGDWVPVSRAAVVGSATLDDLSDVDTGIVAPGEVLMNNGSDWVAAKIYHLHSQGTAATTWNVTHDLGVQYCNVTIVDASDEVVIPQSITFNSTTALTVTFNTAIAGKVVVMGVNSSAT